MNHLRFAVSEPDEWPQACSLGARVRHTLMLFSLGCALGSASSSYAEPLPASVTSDSALLPYYFSIPAPRGQILDNDGRPLARTVTVQRLMLRVPQLENESADAFVGWVDDQWPSIANAFPRAVKPGAEDLRQHFEHRRRLPIAISDTFSLDEVSKPTAQETEEAKEAKDSGKETKASAAAKDKGSKEKRVSKETKGAREEEKIQKSEEPQQQTADAGKDEASASHEFVEVQIEYAREYPAGTTAAHVVGYVTSTGAPLRGPLHHGEPLWREVEGRAGLESTMEKNLRGEPGLLVVCYDKDGRAVKRQVLKEPVPGRDVVTTLRRELQEEAEEALASSKRAGAMVLVDVSTGNLVALASAPVFDPGAFARGMNAKTLEKLTEDKAQPLFHRAISGLYPPGSVFKPFVALAGLRQGRLDPFEHLACGPELTIAGRKFRNWSETDSGYFDLNAAIIRSCNTYFYQAAIRIGDQPILNTAREFGFGDQVQLPLVGASKGVIPESVPSPHGQANLSIGQSPLLSSPLEVALAMAALADGHRRPKPRLVAQIQEQSGEVISATVPDAAGRIRFSVDELIPIYNAMYSVVNHKDGTAPKARVKSLRVHGKTGTSQWSNNGDSVSAVWFAGFVKDCDPPLAFAVVIEGRKGENLFGGSTAAPLAGRVLTSIASSPAKYGFKTRKVSAPYESYALGLKGQVPDVGLMQSPYDMGSADVYADAAHSRGSSYSGYGYDRSGMRSNGHADDPYESRFSRDIRYRRVNPGAVAEVQRAIPVTPSGRYRYYTPSAPPPGYYQPRHEYVPSTRRSRLRFSFPR